MPRPKEFPAPKNAREAYRLDQQMWHNFLALTPLQRDWAYGMNARVIANLPFNQLARTAYQAYKFRHFMQRLHPEKQGLRITVLSFKPKEV